MQHGWCDACTVVLYHVWQAVHVKWTSIWYQVGTCLALCSIAPVPSIPCKEGGWWELCRIRERLPQAKHCCHVCRAVLGAAVVCACVASRPLKCLCLLAVLVAASFRGWCCWAHVAGKGLAHHAGISTVCALSALVHSSQGCHLLNGIKLILSRSSSIRLDTHRW